MDSDQQNNQKVVSGAFKKQIFKPSNLLRGLRNNNKNFKKIFIILAFVVGAITIFAVWQGYENRDVYIIVGRRAITKQQVEEAKAADASYIKSLGNEEGFVTDESEIKSRLIFEAALENEAEKAKVSVSQDEINSAFAQIAPGLPVDYAPSDADSNTVKANKVRNFQKEKFGWSEEYSNRKQKTVLLKVKMKQLLYMKSVLQVSIPFDETNSQQVEQLARDRLLPAVNERKDFKETQDSIRLISNLAAASVIYEANRDAAPKLFSPTSWNAVNNLEAPGDISEIIRDENYFYIYRLLERSDGKFNSWDDFSAKNIKDAEIISSTFSLHKLLPLRSL